MRFRNSAVSFLVYTALVSHIVITAFENMPDARISLGMKMSWLRKIPQWRFFAPNPGIENLHVMYRTREIEQWTQWTELSFTRSAKYYAALWNPGGRAPKALFDTAQQLRTLAGYGSSFEWALGSESYKLMRDVVRSSCVTTRRRGSFQFMILASIPGTGRDGLKPIVVSPPETIDVTSSCTAAQATAPQSENAETTHLAWI